MVGDIIAVLKKKTKKKIQVLHFFKIHTIIMNEKSPSDICTIPVKGSFIETRF